MLHSRVSVILVNISPILTLLELCIGLIGGNLGLKVLKA